MSHMAKKSSVVFISKIENYIYISWNGIKGKIAGEWIKLNAEKANFQRI